MSWWEWLVYVLTLLAHEPAAIPETEARASGCVSVAYASMKRDAVLDEECACGEACTCEECDCQDGECLVGPVAEPPPPAAAEPACPDGKCSLPQSPARTVRRYR